MPATLIRGRYEVVDTISKGPLFSVYRARHQKSSRPVALKFLFPPVDALRRARFQAEARCLSRMMSKNAAACFDIRMEPNGWLYSVMDYVPIEREKCGL